MSTIKAPFNFVPLSESVYSPDWADLISHDIPFEDGVSGMIELEITAESPIFVRNGHTQKDAEDKNSTYQSFCKNPDGKYFIPSTSIKGAVRNVFEIISFSKMSQISNDRYGIRDLKLDQYKKEFCDVHCGWMRLEGEKIKISDRGIPRRISHKTIDEKFGTDFCIIFSDERFLKKESNRSPLVKYKMLEEKKRKNRFVERTLNPNNAADNRIEAFFSDDEGLMGTIVFTGQAGKREEKTNYKKASGKFYEFVFLEKEETLHTLSSDIYEDFCFIYQDSSEWIYWRGRLEKNEQIPVFFSLNKDEKVIHIGLSYLYKLPYPQKIKEYLPNKHQSSDLDLTECVFGMTNKEEALRGRVQFSHAVCVSGEPYKDSISPYMGSPKPTYYPIYIKQEGQEGYLSEDSRATFKTMFNKDARLKGWKRYPIKDYWETVFDTPENQEKNLNPFIPLSAESKFKCKVRFHNLRHIELGALLTALELKENSSHSIGFAKAYGYGRSKIKIQSISDLSKDKINSLKDEFVEDITKQIKNYEKGLKEFYAMLSPKDLKTPLEYMELKDFITCKSRNPKKGLFGEYLQPYTELIKPNIQEKIVPVKIAIVSIISGKIKQARLLDDAKNTKSFNLERTDKIKLKVGDKIEVKPKMKGNNIESLYFEKKL